MKITITFITLGAASLLFANTAFALPIDIPSKLKEPHEENHPFVSLQADYLAERELEGGGELSGQVYTAKFGVPVELLGSWDWYAEFGTLVDGEIASQTGGANITAQLEDGETLVAGAGANWTPVFIPEFYDFSVFTDIKYRQIFNSDYDSVSVNGTSFTNVNSGDDPEWQEWQVAVGAATKFADAFIPYAGASYSDVNADSSVVADGTRYDNDVSSDETIGAFAGLAFAPEDSAFSLDFQARFIAEEAYTAAVTYKF